MKYFDDYPQAFRLLFGIAAIFLLALAVLNLHNYATFQTDENVFETSPSQLYVSKSFPARLSQLETKKYPTPTITSTDSLLAGDLVLELNGQECDSMRHLQQVLAALAPEAELELLVKRPKLNRKIRFQLHHSALADSLVREIPASVVITQVDRGGASDRAGVLVGDLVLSINGQSFRNAYEADRIMRRAEANRAIAYKVLRDNRTLTLQVTLARFGARLHVILGFLSGLSFWGMAMLLGMSRPRLHVARLLAVTFLVLSFPIMMIYQRVVTLDLQAKLSLVLLPGCLLGAIPLLMHSSAYFPKERPELAQRKWLIVAPYVIAGCSYAFFVLGKFQSRELLGLGLMALLLFLLFVYVRFRRQCAAEYKKLNRAVRWAGSIAGALCALTAFFVLAFRQSVPRMGYAVVPLILLPLSYLYVIGRYRLLDLNLRVGRNVQYLIVSWGCGILFVGGFLYSLMSLPALPIAVPNFRMSDGYLEIVDEPLAPARLAVLEKVVFMLLAIALFFVFRRLYRAVQGFLARKFYRTGYDYRRAVNELSEIMATKLTMLDLAKGISRKLVEHIQLKRVGVMFFRDQKESSCQEAYGFEENEWREFCVAVDRPLINTLQKFRSESRFSAEYLPPALKERFHQHGFVHILPIRFKEKLVGALLIGEKLSEAGFHEEDLHYLAAVAKQASLAIENAFLYEELAEKERLKHELEIARRIQLASLPQTTPKIPGLEIAGISIPALEVGGDYFDYLNGKPDQITVIVGDVSGKGTSAALYMSKVQGILRSLHDFGLSPRELFIRANHLLRQALDRSSFVTSIGACFDASAKQLRLARAGHLPLFYYQARTGRIEMITPKGLGLGLDDDRLFAAELEERSLNYETGDVFLFVTDGVTEAQGEHGGEFGEESLTEILSRNFAEPAHRIRDHVITAVKSFVNGEYQHDDLTLVVVKAI